MLVVPYDIINPARCRHNGWKTDYTRQQKNSVVDFLPIRTCVQRPSHMAMHSAFRTYTRCSGELNQLCALLIDWACLLGSLAKILNSFRKLLMLLADKMEFVG